MAGGASRPVPQPFWRESDKSQGFGDGVYLSLNFLPYEAGAVLVRQLRGPHLSTWP